jgi:ubiquinone/menaquinone biosynthesis C-methylase UbiE
MTEEIKKWWNDNAKDFQENRKIPIKVIYGVGGSDEEILKLIGEVKDKNILEIGCGAAQCGIAFAKQGARVIGIDISEEQLKIAKRLVEKNKVPIKLLQGDIINLSQIESNSQDIVFSSWAFMYVDDLPSCFKETYRVLKENGIFVFSTDHPFWRRISKESLKIKKSYFENGSYSEPYMKGTFIAQDHKVSDYINWLVESGFNIEKMIEPNPMESIKEEKDIWMKDYDSSKIDAMKWLPRTIIFKARKLKGGPSNL